MAPAPKSLRAIRDASVLEIAWPDGSAYRLPFKLIRFECPCAQCIHEITGERMIQAESISEDIHPVDLGYSGNYALRIVWSDGHASGIYTWERLQWLCSHLQAVKTA